MNDYDNLDIEQYIKKPAEYVYKIISLYVWAYERFNGQIEFAPDYPELIFYDWYQHNIDDLVVHIATQPWGKYII